MAPEEVKTWIWVLGLPTGRRAEVGDVLKESGDPSPQGEDSRAVV